jgi:hypothetical protein
VATFTVERYSRDQTMRHGRKVQAPAPKGKTRVVKDVSICGVQHHSHGHLLCC